LLVRYADGSPDFRMDVLVVVKHMPGEDVAANHAIEMAL